MPLNALKSSKFLPSPSASGGKMTTVRLTQHLRWEAQCLKGAMGFGFGKTIERSDALQIACVETCFLSTASLRPGVHIAGQ